MEKVNVMKKIALFLVVASFAVAMVACQAAVGKAGADGTDGQTGLQGIPGPQGDPGMVPFTPGAAPILSAKVVEPNVDVLRGYPTAPAPIDLQLYFPGGIGEVKYQLTAVSSGTDGEALDGPFYVAGVTEPASLVNGSLSAPIALTDGFLNVAVRKSMATANLTLDNAVLHTDFTVKATDATGVSPNPVIIKVRANKKPTVGSGGTTMFRVGTQSAATKKDGALIATADTSLVPATLIFTHPFDCDMFNSCRINFASNVAGDAKAPYFDDDGYGAAPDSLDALEYSATVDVVADAAKVTLATSNVKNKNGISITGLVSTATAAGVNVATEAIPIRVKATDANGLYVDDLLIMVNVDAQPVVEAAIPDTLVDLSEEFTGTEAKTFDIAGVEGFFKDPDGVADGLTIRSKSSNVRVATVTPGTIPGDLTITITGNVGYSDITVRATEPVASDRATTTGIGQWVEQTFRVTVQR